MPLIRERFPPLQPSPEEPVLIPKPAPPKLGSLAGPSETTLLGDMRMATIWYTLMERSWQEALQRLGSIVGTDLHEDAAKVNEFIPCIVDVSEAHTKREEESIRRVHRRFSQIFASLVDRLVRYRPESRQFAWDWLKQEITNWRVLWRPYECERFRAPEAQETEGRGKKRKRSNKE